MILDRASGIAEPADKNVRPMTTSGILKVVPIKTTSVKHIQINIIPRKFNSPKTVSIQTIMNEFAPMKAMHIMNVMGYNLRYFFGSGQRHVRISLIGHVYSHHIFLKIPPSGHLKRLLPRFLRSSSSKMYSVKNSNHNQSW